MKSRWIATVVCLLYLSISTIFAAVHHHDGDSDAAAKCAACAWHHENQVDIPTVSVAFERPETLVFFQLSAPTFSHDLSFQLHPCRGPPLLPLPSCP